MAHRVNLGSFWDGLGTLMYVAGALEFERPFLVPLYKSRGSVRIVPCDLKYNLEHLAKQISTSRNYPCATELHTWAVVPQVDAQDERGYADGCQFWMNRRFQTKRA